MQFTYSHVLAAVTLLKGATAYTTLPGDCKSVTTITTANPIRCDIVCPTPTVTCRPGQPPKSPEPTHTIIDGCTVKIETGGICDCATCKVPLPTLM